MIRNCASKRMLCLILSIITVFMAVPVLSTFAFPEEADTSWDESNTITFSDETISLEVEDEDADQLVAPKDIEESTIETEEVIEDLPELDILEITPAATNAPVILGGDSEPLTVKVYPNGSLGIFVGPDKQYQYFREYANGTIWHFTVDGVDKKYATNYLSKSGRNSAEADKFADYNNVSNTVIGTIGLGDTTLEPDGRTAKTVWEKDGIIFTQYITLQDGARSIQQRWTLTNNSSKTLTNARMINGGDTYFNGDDKGYSFYHPLLKMVYIIKNSTSGMMSFRGDESTPFDHYYAGQFRPGKDRAVIDGNLSPNVADPDFKDNCVFMQWNYGTIARGATVETKAQQEWSESGPVMFVSPMGQTAAPNATVSYNITLINVRDSNITVNNLEAISSSGYDVRIIGNDSVTVPANGSSVVTVELDISPDALHGDIDMLTFTGNYREGITEYEQSAKVWTTVDDTQPAIRKIDIVSLNNTRLVAAVDYYNITSPRQTTVEILDLSGTVKKTLMVPAYETRSETDFIFDISDLARNTDYIIRAGVEGILYPSQKRFTIGPLQYQVTYNYIRKGTNEQVKSASVEIMEINTLVTISDPLINSYIPLYYTIDNDSIQKGLDVKITVDRDMTINVYFASTVIETSVPVKMMFAAFASDGGEITSPEYSITNRSDLPVTVELDSLTQRNDTMDGLTFVTTPVSADGEFNLKLIGISNLDTIGNLANGTQSDNTGSMGQLGIAETDKVGKFKIGGSYQGPFSSAKTPEFDAVFKIVLVTP